ncbi:MAG: hypothetical protein FJZ63_03730 [Chlamydiae bacterium]|nr:hypothetical protein [Chlamydiota bacterium]
MATTQAVQSRPSNWFADVLRSAFDNGLAPTVRGVIVRSYVNTLHAYMTREEQALTPERVTLLQSNATSLKEQVEKLLEMVTSHEDIARIVTTIRVARVAWTTVSTLLPGLAQLPEFRQAAQSFDLAERTLIAVEQQTDRLRAYVTTLEAFKTGNASEQGLLTATAELKEAFEAFDALSGQAPAITESILRAVKNYIRQNREFFYREDLTPYATLLEEMPQEEAAQPTAQPAPQDEMFDMIARIMQAQMLTAVLQASGMQRGDAFDPFSGGQGLSFNVVEAHGPRFVARAGEIFDTEQAPSSSLSIEERRSTRRTTARREDPSATSRQDSSESRRGVKRRKRGND